MDQPHKISIPVMPPMTDRQRALLVFCARYWAEKQYLPSHLEMRDFLGIKSNNATPYVNALVRKGYLIREAGLGKQRNLKLTLAAIMQLEAMGEPFSVGKDGQVRIEKDKDRTTKKKTTKKKKQ